MKKFILTLTMLFCVIGFSGCDGGSSARPSSSFVGEWELVEMTGGIGGIEHHFESPSPKTLKVSELDDGLYFTFNNLLNDGFGNSGTEKYTFVEEVSIFDNKKHIMLGRKLLIEGYFTIFLNLVKMGTICC